MQDALKQAELEIQQHKDRNEELTSQFNNSSVLLQEQHDLSAKQKAEYDALVEMLANLEVKAAQYRDNAIEKERKMEAELQQLKVMFFKLNIYNCSAGRTSPTDCQASTRI